MVLTTLKFKDCTVDVEEKLMWLRISRLMPNLCIPKIHCFNLILIYLSTDEVELFYVFNNTICFFLKNKIK